MTFDQIPSGTELLLDANTLVHPFTSNAAHGAACTRLIEEIQQNDFRGRRDSAHVLLDVAHRMMTVEAMDRFGWPLAEAGIVSFQSDDPRFVSPGSCPVQGGQDDAKAARYARLVAQMACWWLVSARFGSTESRRQY
jgi:hypothetical protein